MKILYFAQVRETIGRAEEELSPPSDIRTVQALTDWLATRSDGHRSALAQSSTVRVAVNMTYAKPESPVEPDDEVAFFPPVTGG